MVVGGRRGRLAVGIREVVVGEGRVDGRGLLVGGAGGVDADVVQLLFEDGGGGGARGRGRRRRKGRRKGRRVGRAGPQRWSGRNR